MKHFSILALSIAVIGMVALVNSPLVSAQTCGIGNPPEETMITFSDGSELLVTSYFTDRERITNNSIEIVGDGFSISISYAPDNMEFQGIGFRVNNSYTSSAWGEGIIDIFYSSVNWGPNKDEIADLSVLPDEYRELCINLKETCGELLESDEFCALLEDEKKDVLEKLREEMERIRDGYGGPTARNYIVDITYNIGGLGPDEKMWRGYTLTGPISMSIKTTNPIGDLLPDIQISSSSSLDNERWNLHIDPVKEICEIWLDNVEAIQQISEEDWGWWVKRVQETLEFHMAELPLLIESGFIDPVFEFEILLKTSLNGLETYPIEVTYPHEWSDVIL